MQFTPGLKMSRVVHTNYLLMPVLRRFGIELGFGDKTIETVCLEKGIHVEFFLDIINSYHDANYFPKKHLAGFSAAEIIGYLVSSHKYYLEEKVPAIEKAINRLVETSKAEKAHLKLIKSFFSEYREELIAHIKREDEVVYPYVLQLEKCFLDKCKNREIYDKIKNEPISRFADEHDNMEEKLYDLKNILIKYLTPQDDQSLLQGIIKDLFELERDLADHARIEDKVLIPKIAGMEKEMEESLQGR